MQEAAAAAAEALQSVGAAAITAPSPFLPPPRLPQSLLHPLLLLLPPLSISPPSDTYGDGLRRLTTATTSQWFRLDESDVFYNGRFFNGVFFFCRSGLWTPVYLSTQSEAD